MGPLPYTKMTLWTELRPHEAAARLRRIVSVNWFTLTPPPEPFRGRLDGMHFKIVRVLGWIHRNSFQPVLVGQILPSAGGTAICLRMRLHAFVAAFMAFWFGGLVLGATMMLRAAMRHGLHPGSANPSSIVGLLIVGGMMLAGYLLVNLSFWSEVKRARQILCEALECTESVPAQPLVRT